MEQANAFPEPPGTQPTGVLMAELQSTRFINPLIT